MAITTIANVATFTGVTYTAGQNTRLGVLIPMAERAIARRSGWVFYDALVPTSDASQDWLLVVSLVSQAYLYAEDPEARAALLGVFQSERIGDYSYTMKDGATLADLLLNGDPRIAEIIAAYQIGSSLVGLVVNGPTRVAIPVVDADVSRALT